MRTKISRILGVLAALAVTSAAAASAEEAPSFPWAAERLAEAIRFQTISWEEAGGLDREAFLAFRAFVERSYPRVHASLRPEVVNEYSLLRTWPGKDPSRKPCFWMRSVRT
jgi:carboxypeptidase PM20D1